MCMQTQASSILNVINLQIVKGGKGQVQAVWPCVVKKPAPFPPSSYIAFFISKPGKHCVLVLTNLCTAYILSEVESIADVHKAISDHSSLEKAHPARSKIVFSTRLYLGLRRIFLYTVYQ